MKPLTISIQYEKSSFDILVKEDQRIEDVFQILKENQLILLPSQSPEVTIRSWRLKTIINSRYTFRQARIENGDILTVILD